MNPPNFYELLGGDAGVHALVERFYRLMDERAEFSRIRHLHPADLAHSKEKLYLFLSGWLGGPPLYVEKYGHPMLRRRHLPFPIGSDERDQWMRCMIAAMRESGLEGEMLERLAAAFFNTADFMRNRAEAGQSIPGQAIPGQMPTDQETP